jgi:hypothetical protein
MNSATFCYDYRSKNQYYEGNIFLVKPNEIGNDPRTTIMIRNIPNKYTITDLADEIDAELAGAYDFLYLPCDIKVAFSLFRTIATLATVSSISYRPFTSKNSIRCSTAINGQNSEARRYLLIDCRFAY